MSLPKKIWSLISEKFVELILIWVRVAERQVAWIEVEQNHTESEKVSEVILLILLLPNYFGSHKTACSSNKLWKS